MNPPPQDGGDPINIHFTPMNSHQWELTNGNINHIDPGGGTILHNYCLNINFTPLAVFRYLIEINSSFLTSYDNQHHTPLYYALQEFDPNCGGNIDTLTYLLSQNGVNVNTKNENGYNLFHMACEHIDKLPIDIFKLLIENKGGDVNILDEDNDSPLYYALRYFNRDDGDGITVLTYLLHQTDVKVNIRGYNGCSLLHLACENINKLPIDVFKHLIEILGSDVNAQNDDNQTPIHCILRFFNPNRGGNISILTYLLSHDNININTKGENGNTLLHYACQQVNKLPLEAFKSLIGDKCVDFNMHNDSYNTPLHIAIRDFAPKLGGNITVLAYLLAQTGVNFNKQNKNGHTLLHLACKTEYNHIKVAEVDTFCVEVIEIVIEGKIKQVLGEVIL